MANPTSNFGWQMPTPTDLVTDLPADFEVFGQAVDTSLADLKGGTTGQVLSKNSNTNMDFVWVTSDDANAIQNTIVDAKGDLIAASANDTPARLAVGANGTTLVADSSTSTGLRYQAPKVANAIYNSGFDVWQRGTTFTGAAPYYAADRWFCFRSGAAAGATFTRQASSLTGLQYAIRAQRDSGNTSTNSLAVGQSLETADSIRFAGKTVTFSFWARAGANYSPASSILGAAVYSGTGTDQQYWNTGFTGVATVLVGNATLTTSWQRFTFTGAVASNATEIAFGLVANSLGTAGANDWYEVTGIQLEEGSVATPYNRMSGTIQGELAACQRYYYRFASEGKLYASFSIGGYFESTTKYIGRHQHPVSMRTNPTTLDYANLSIIDTSGTFYAVSAAAIDTNTNTSLGMMCNFTVSGATPSRYGSVLINNNTGAYLGIGAEL